MYYIWALLQLLLTMIPKAFFTQVMTTVLHHDCLCHINIIITTRAHCNFLVLANFEVENFLNVVFVFNELVRDFVCIPVILYQQHLSKCLCKFVLFCKNIYSIDHLLLNLVRFQQSISCFSFSF